MTPPGQSRHDSADEGAGCKAKGIDPIELEVAFDGLSVMVNPAEHMG